MLRAMMKRSITMLGLSFTLVTALAACSKKEEGKGSASSGEAAKAPAKSASGLAWEPDGYDKLSAGCKKALACCEEIAKAEGATKAEDYNLKCSGPAMWKEDECVTDMKSRATVLESGGKPVPDACK